MSPLLMRDYSTTVDAPVEEVFEHFCNVGEWKQWVRPIQRSRVAGQGPLRQGARVEFVTDMFALQVPLGAKILRYVSNEVIEWGIVSKLGRIIHRFEFAPLSESSSTVRHIEFGEGIFAALLRPMAKKIEKFDRQWADDLVSVFAGGAN